MNTLPIVPDEPCTTATSSRRRVCMITHSFYESDNRVLRYAEALADRGDSVEVLALRRSPTIPREEVLNNVTVLRIQDRFGKNEQTKLAFVWPLVRFLLLSSWWILRRHRRQSYDLVHVHNIPDFLVFAAWYPKLTGSRVVLDIHDIVPEFFSSKFMVSERAALTRVLRLIEKASAAFADHVILSNHLWLDKYAARSAKSEKCSVFINHVDERIFHLKPIDAAATKRLILFPGGLQWHQGLDLAIRAFAQICDRLPDVDFHIYGDGNAKPDLIRLTQELNMESRVRFFDPLGLREIADIMARAHLGVVPKRADSFGNEAYSTKIMEFMAAGVPVVVSSTKIDRFYFDDSVVRFFTSGDVDSLASAMLEVLSNATLRDSLVKGGSDYVAKHSWENRKADYLNLVDSLCEEAELRN